MTDILVVNHGLHQVCGVHDLGYRLFKAIPDSLWQGYSEPTDPTELYSACDEHEPRVLLVNYRADLLPWVPQALAAIHVTKVAVAHNYEPHTLAALHAQHRAAGFDLTLALEPQLFEIDGVIWSGRPMPPPLRVAPVDHDGVVRVGSFGFAFGHKRFDLVAREVTELNRPAVFRLHCPTAHFGGSPEQTEAVIASVHRELTGQAHAHITTDHRPGFEVVRWLAECHANALLYDPGQPDAGLSSALDYLLAAGRPILVTPASMFRHAQPAAKCWPEWRLADVIEGQDRLAVNVRERYDQLSQGYAAGIRQLLERA